MTPVGFLYDDQTQYLLVQNKVGDTSIDIYHSRYYLHSLWEKFFHNECNIYLYKFGISKACMDFFVLLNNMTL